MNLKWLLLIPIGLPLAVLAQVSRFQPLHDIHAAAADYVTAQSPEGTVVGVAPLDARLRLPLCLEPLDAAATHASGTAINVAVRCARPEWAVHVPVRSTLRRPVIVLRQGVARGELLAETHLALEQRELTGGQGYFSDMREVLGKTLRRPLQPGSVLAPELLTEPLLVRRGELVTLLGRAGAMEVRTQARAMSDGSRGQPIQVQNTASGRIVGAVVRSGGLVEVEL